ncbi:hypothetical protein CWC11_08590 [Pseudoalteromonas sp. S3178]|nr:hypothetical protein CWC11_08590 [Pseudoalteromonas sp. S3178]
MICMDENITEFGNMSVLLNTQSDTSYCIQWFSKMTGATVILTRKASRQYQVTRKWATGRELDDVSSEFTHANQAIIHFLNNVDIAKINEQRIAAAKYHCINLFVKAEGLRPITNLNLPKPRLQEAIGKKVMVKSTLGNNNIATGLLLQLVGNQVEIQVNPDDAYDDQPRQKFYTKQVSIY